MADTGGKGVAVALLEEAAKRDAQPTVTSCAFCPWSFVGTAGEGRVKAAQHRAQKHPDVRVTKRRRNNSMRESVAARMERKKVTT